MDMLVLGLCLALSPIPLDGPHPLTHRCAVACRCPCDRAVECECDGERCPVDVLVTGRITERVSVPIRGLRPRSIACPDRLRPSNLATDDGDCEACRAADEALRSVRGR